MNGCECGSYCEQCSEHVIRSGKSRLLGCQEWKILVQSFVDSIGVVVKSKQGLSLTVVSFQMPEIDPGAELSRLRMMAVRDACSVASHLETCPDHVFSTNLRYAKS